MTLEKKDWKSDEERTEEEEVIETFSDHTTSLKSKPTEIKVTAEWSIINEREVDLEEETQILLCLMRKDK